jgi:KUP system potassium uptake protein
MVRHAAQFGALQENLVTLTVHFEETPRVPRVERVEVAHLGHGLWHVTARFGFIEIPNLRAVLASARERGCLVDLDKAIYFAARDDVVPSKEEPQLARWRRGLFRFMYRNAVRTVDRFDLPAGQFVEIGRQQEL